MAFKISGSDGLYFPDGSRQKTNATHEEHQTATAGQTVITTSGVSFVMGENQVRLFVNGILLYMGSDYTELNTYQLQVTSPLSNGDKILLAYNDVSVNNFASTGWQVGKVNEIYTAVEGQTDFVLQSTAYQAGTGNVEVFRNGLLQYRSEYSELADKLFRFNTGVSAGDKILFAFNTTAGASPDGQLRIDLDTAGDASGASMVKYQPLVGDVVSVHTKLRELEARILALETP